MCGDDCEVGVLRKVWRVVMWMVCCVVLKKVGGMMRKVWWVCGVRGVVCGNDCSGGGGDAEESEMCGE